MIERGKNEALQTDRSLKENYRQGETVNDNDWRVNGASAHESRPLKNTEEGILEKPEKSLSVMWAHTSECVFQDTI